MGETSGEKEKANVSVDIVMPPRGQTEKRLYSGCNLILSDALVVKVLGQRLERCRCWTLVQDP